MSKRAMTMAAAVALVACGGGAKQADSPGTCPEGTVLKGEDCVPPGSSDDSTSPPPKHDDDGDKPSSSGGSTSSGGGSGGGGSSGGDTPPATDKTPYDKDAVEMQLKRAARQVKANCGSATDEEGKATGPWGTTKASVVIGRNGHIKQVTVPSPYDGKPVGACVVHAFQRIQFPPYGGSTDVVIDWDIEIVQPKH
ncbi:MAG TPA: hypothetical protein VIF15_16770 [Polyangiaceae bacterium]